MYTKEYFIKKFKAIPEDKIGNRKLTNHCALWHCGVRDNYLKEVPEAIALGELLKKVPIYGAWKTTPYATVYLINDFGGGTPKQHILEALNKIPDDKN